jgi:prefoldin subunit 5
MTRIIIPTTTLVGRKLISITQQIEGVSADVTRLKAIVDAIGSANLETSTEALIPTGQGATIYAGIGQIKTALDGLASLVAVIDQG